MLDNDREKYEKFCKNFGLQLKYRRLQRLRRSNKELLQDLLLFYSSERGTSWSPWRNTSAA